MLHIAVLGVWCLLQVVVFIAQAITTTLNKHISNVRAIMGWTLPVAKGAALAVNLNLAMLLVTKCRVILALLMCEYSMVLEGLHRYAGVGLVAWSTVHVIAHLVNYIRAGMTNGLLMSGTTITGILLIITIIVIWLCSMTRVRTRHYRLFTLTHYLSVLLIAFALIHGTFCLIKTNRGKCGGPSSWKWLIGPGILFFAEQAIVQVRIFRTTSLKRVIVHPSRVIEVIFDKPSLRFKAGQYVYLKIPLISLYEWHPFTLTSSPQDELCSVHVRVIGKWTGKLASILHIDFKPDGTIFCHPIDCLPEMIVDGPYGVCWERALIDSFTNPNVIICIGAGIGQTPFASILKTWWYRFVDYNIPTTHNQIGTSMRKSSQSESYFIQSAEKPKYSYIKH